MLLLQRLLLLLLLLVELGSSSCADAAAPITTSVSSQLVFEVLTSFKQAIKTDPSKALASWDTTSTHDINPCTSNWTGITCEFLSLDNPTLITGLSIQLPGRSLQGSLTPALARLPILTSLDLTSNALSGTYTSLSNFTSSNLHYLSLAQNHFHGPFTLPTSCFPNLIFLSVAQNNFSGLIPSNQLSRCPSLQNLNVSNNHFSGSFFPSGLGINLTSTLVSLDGGVNSFTGPFPISVANCSNLTFLSFPNNHFSGQIPSSIGLGCPNLQFVSLFQNNLSGSVPQDIGMLSQLSYLSIGVNNLGGEIFNFLVNCSALTTLDTSRLPITGRMPEDLGSRLPNLAVLGMEFNMLTGSIPESLGNCSNLTYLLVGFNYNMTGSIPPALFRARSISQLDLQFNLFNGTIPRQIMNLTSLQKAYLNSNQFTGSLPEELSMLASLQALALEHNSLTGHFPDQLFNCTSLISLTLQDNSLIGPVSSSIGSLTSLENFDASDNHLTGQLPLGLTNCTALRSISLRNNTLSDDIPNSIITSLLACRTFNLAQNNLSGPMPNTGFQHMIFLQELDLSYNQLSGSIPTSLASCQDLHYLNLSHNQIVGSIPTTLGGALLEMTDLVLSHNSINGNIPSELGSLKSLQRLDLSYNDLSGAIPSALTKVKHLEFLNLSYNTQLQGAIPEGGALDNLTKTSFIGNPMLCGHAINKTCPINNGGLFSTKWKIILIVVLPVTLVVLVGFIVAGALKSRSKSDMKASWDFHPYLRLTLQDIQQATGNFNVDNVLGSGITGTVYKGFMKDGTILAFKKFNIDSSSLHSFIGELQSVGLIRHRNLIRILGYFSNQQDANILILEYMPNGSLYDHLYLRETDEGLSWEARTRVAVSVAEGLLYLHNDCPSPIVHCDLKPQNILFDANMEVRITDFGLAKVMVSTAVTSSFTENMKGTLGYMAPEVASSGHISRRCDVYSYGVLLMELITARKPFEEVEVQVNSEEDQATMSLVQWVASKLEINAILDIVDDRLQEVCKGSNEVMNQMKELLKLGLQCTQTNPRKRPDMQHVVQALTSICGNDYLLSRKPETFTQTVLLAEIPSAESPIGSNF